MTGRCITFSRSSWCCSFSRRASPRHCSSFWKQKHIQEWSVRVEGPKAKCSAVARGAAAVWKRFTIEKTLEKFSFSSTGRSLLSAAANRPVPSRSPGSPCRPPSASQQASRPSSGSREDGLEDPKPFLISSSTSSLSNVAVLSVSLCLFSRSSVLTYIREQSHYFAVTLQMRQAEGFPCGTEQGLLLKCWHFDYRNQESQNRWADAALILTVTWPVKPQDGNRGTYSYQDSTWQLKPACLRGWSIWAGLSSACCAPHGCSALPQQRSPARSRAALHRHLGTAPLAGAASFIFKPGLLSCLICRLLPKLNISQIWESKITRQF